MLLTPSLNRWTDKQTDSKIMSPVFKNINEILYYMKQECTDIYAVYNFISNLLIIKTLNTLRIHSNEANLALFQILTFMKSSFYKTIFFYIYLVNVYDDISNNLVNNSFNRSIFFVPWATDVKLIQYSHNNKL